LEKIVSKTNETLNLGHHVLADGELDAVTGGTKCTGGSAGGPVTLRALATLLGQLEQAEAQKVR
jgi:hypothetical protein